MYKVAETYIVYTSGGKVTLYVDEEGDLEIMSNDQDIIQEVKDKYYSRKG